MFFVIRIILVSIWICIACFVGILVGIARPFDPRNGKISAALIGWGRHLMGVEIELRHSERLEENKPCVFISNHHSNFDIFPGGYTLPKNTVTIGKKSIIFIPFFGQYFWLSGNLLINRSNRTRAFQTMDVAVTALRDRKVSVWVMPEGTRSRGRGLLPFKKGPFITAIKAQVPLVPVVFSTYTNHLNFNRWKAGKIIIDVLPPIPTIGLAPEDTNTIKDQAFSMMYQSGKALDHEIENATKTV